MRKRIERKLQKQIWIIRRTSPDFPNARVSNLPAIVLDRRAGWFTRGRALEVLAIANPEDAVAPLLELFADQTDKIELWETALSFENKGGRAAVPQLIVVLQNDANPYRRHAAARALGWIPFAGRKAAKALVHALLDHQQPQPVREEAAESLAYSSYRPAIPALISVLREADERIRFWAVFALGGTGKGSQIAVDALTRMLTDEAVPAGNWWSVGKEALAMLDKLDPGFHPMFEAEINHVRNDPNASEENIRWADFYF